MAFFNTIRPVLYLPAVRLRVQINAAVVLQQYYYRSFGTKHPVSNRFAPVCVLFSAAMATSCRGSTLHSYRFCRSVLVVTVQLPRTIRSNPHSPSFLNDVNSRRLCLPFLDIRRRTSGAAARSAHGIFEGPETGGGVTKLLRKRDGKYQQRSVSEWLRGPRGNLR